MRPTRQGLLNSASYSAVVVAAGLGSAFEARPPAARARKLKNRAMKGALVAATAMTAVSAIPVDALAQARCVLDVTSSKVDVVTGLKTATSSAVTGIEFNTGKALTGVELEVTDASNFVTATKIITVDIPVIDTDATLLQGAKFGTALTGATLALEGGSFLTGIKGVSLSPFVTSVTPIVSSLAVAATPDFGGASAVGADSFACGPDATANGVGATAVGDSAKAVGDFAAAFGFNSYAAGKGATAVGDKSLANGANATAFGYLSKATGKNSTAMGAHSFAVGGISSSAVGTKAGSVGSFNSAFGQGAYTGGVFNSASGSYASAVGVANSVSGSGAKAIGINNAAFGTGSYTAGFGNTAVGTGAAAVGTLNTAVGYSSLAVSPNATAVGANSSATASYSTAIGGNTSTTAEGAVAIGVDSDGDGAFSNRENEFVLGTADHTYTATGITSGASRARQSGPLEVVTSDAAGHLATDGGEIFRRLDEAESGIALAMSMEDPDLIGNERFGARMNYGNFEGANALSWTFAGVLGRDVLRVGDRLSVGGGFGVGFDEGNAEDVWGGRVGAQWTWGNAPAIHR